MRSTVLSLLAVLALAGCAPKAIPLDISAVDPRVFTGCVAAKAKIGEDAVVSARRKEFARRCEASRRQALAEFVKGIQETGTRK